MEEIKNFRRYILRRIQNAERNLENAIDLEYWSDASQFEAQIAELNTILTQYQHNFRNHLTEKIEL